MTFSLKKLGPGLLFAGAAIGVSHLVQSTRAGADFGYGFLWALILINIIKYPFFEFGSRYAAITGKSLLEGYQSLHKGVLIFYIILSFATMFTIQTAVTIVTASLANQLFGFELSLNLWSTIITIFCAAILLIGQYKVLDRIIKVIVITLTLTTIYAVIVAFFKSSTPIDFKQVLPESSTDIAFLIAFMGWMPAPLDISIWQSLWTVEKQKEVNVTEVKNVLFDFNIGYITTIILAICFLSLGALVMFNTNEIFSSSGIVFSKQLITLYTKNLGNNFTIIIAIAAFTTMFSTTLTTLDASPRAMAKATSLLTNLKKNNFFLFWSLILVLGTLIILNFFTSEMQLLIKTATILSFLTAPFYAIVNHILIFKLELTPEQKPSKFLKILSIAGILGLLFFSLWYLRSLIV